MRPAVSPLHCYFIRIVKSKMDFVGNRSKRDGVRIEAPIDRAIGAIWFAFAFGWRLKIKKVSFCPTVDAGRYRCVKGRRPLQVSRRETHLVESNNRCQLLFRTRNSESAIGHTAGQPDTKRSTPYNFLETNASATEATSFVPG